MSEYEKRIFEALTSNEERFKAATEIAGHIPRIKSTLIKSYWLEVKLELERLVKESNEGFSVGLDEDIFRVNSKCFLYLNNNKAQFHYERLTNDQSFGLWFNPNLVDTEKVKNYRESLDPDLSGFSSGDWWFAMRKIGDDFSNIDSLIRILPVTVKDHSKQRAQELFDFAVENKEHLKHILDDCKNE